MRLASSDQDNMAAGTGLTTPNGDSLQFCTFAHANLQLNIFSIHVTFDLNYLILQVEIQNYVFVTAHRILFFIVV